MFGLALGAFSWRSRRDPLLFLLVMLSTVALFMTTPYVGYLDNITVLYFLSLILAFFAFQILPINYVALLLIVFGLILLGLVSGRLATLPESGLAWLNYFILYIALPPLFFQLVSRTPFEQLANPRFVFVTTLSTVATFALALLVGMWLRRGNLPEATIAGVVGAYANIGYMGPGLTLAALGTAAAVPTALVTVENLDTNDTREVSTDTEGRFRFPVLPPGRYELRVQKSGFTSYVQGPIVLRLNQQADLNVKLDVSGVTETINVTADAPLINTTNAEVGANFDTKRVSELPRRADQIADRIGERTKRSRDRARRRPWLPQLEAEAPNVGRRFERRRAICLVLSRRFDLAGGGEHQLHRRRAVSGHGDCHRRRWRVPRVRPDVVRRGQCRADRPDGADDLQRDGGS